ncbi:hypothetical protein K439DRAFT_1615445 [Ramaria rubella]|nr:hypothetical protein K439DRAFT_1615445 [Ramaria rubella]
MSVPLIMLHLCLLTHTLGSYPSAYHQHAPPHTLDGVNDHGLYRYTSSFLNAQGTTRRLTCIAHLKALVFNGTAQDQPPSRPPVLIQGCSNHQPSTPILPAIQLHHCTLIWSKGFAMMTPAQAADKCTDLHAQHPPLSSTYLIRQCWPSRHGCYTAIKALLTAIKALLTAIKAFLTAIKAFLTAIKAFLTAEHIFPTMHGPGQLQVISCGNTGLRACFPRQRLFEDLKKRKHERIRKIRD